MYRVSVKKVLFESVIFVKNNLPFVQIRNKIFYCR